jgi:hypothetical protein
MHTEQRHPSADNRMTATLGSSLSVLSLLFKIYKILTQSFKLSFVQKTFYTQVA